MNQFGRHSRIYKDNTGKSFVVVDRPQRKQTLGRWVFNVPADLEKYVGARDMFGGRYLNWDMRQVGREEWVNRAKDDVYSLCLLDECDEEDNEFGPVSP